ncbi:MAG: two-component system response regulator AtoC [Kiritimatiellia bacterium]|jgi:two-component system response regulator AtoC
MRKILVVDDEQGARESLKAIFSGKFNVKLAENAEQALKRLARDTYDLVLLDVIMPGKDGLTLLDEIRALYAETPIIMCSASTNVKPVVEAIKRGACDYITKPYDVDEIRFLVDRVIESRRLHRQVTVLQDEVNHEYPVQGIIGNSDSFKHALSDAKKAAESDASVLITGESGTGKELVARLVHMQSARHLEPFVAVHCGALPETLMESELFGYEKGAFTGAMKQKLGRFDLAGDGTLFFDEVTEMSLATQVKLLRVLQEKEFMRVGGIQIVQSNARIIAACNRVIKDYIADEKFRDDLYYRLSVVPIHLPPLRERGRDVLLLAKSFIEMFRVTMDVMSEAFDEQAEALMLNYPWPGNVRELKNIVERMLVLHGDQKIIRAEYLPAEFHTGQPRSVMPEVQIDEELTLEDAVNTYERQLVEKALEASGGVQTKAAEMLGTTRRILKYRMEKLNIEAPK